MYKQTSKSSWRKFWVETTWQTSSIMLEQISDSDNNKTRYTFLQQNEKKKLSKIVLIKMHRTNIDLFDYWLRSSLFIRIFPKMKNKKYTTTNKENCSLSDGHWVA